jgi:hypothetical protein
MLYIPKARIIAESAGLNRRRRSLSQLDHRPSPRRTGVVPSANAVKSHAQRRGFCVVTAMSIMLWVKPQGSAIVSAPMSRAKRGLWSILSI